MWHAKTLKNMLVAWARNKRLSFGITVFSLFLTLVFGAYEVYQGFAKPHPLVISPRSTGNATTSGPNSPAVTGPGNSITYGQSDSNRKDKKAKE